MVAIWDTKISNKGTEKEDMQVNPGGRKRYFLRKEDWVLAFCCPKCTSPL